MFSHSPVHAATHTDLRQTLALLKAEEKEVLSRLLGWFVVMIPACCCRSGLPRHHVSPPFNLPLRMQGSKLAAQGIRISRLYRSLSFRGYAACPVHRFRFCMALAQAGASVVDMQVAGRWKSSTMPAHYAKAELAERGAIARFKEKRGKR